MQRRQFIGITAAGIAGLVLPATGADGESAPLATLATPELLDILRDERAVREIGQCYRETVPNEDSAQALNAAILTDPHATASVPLRTRLNDQVRRDFADGRTVTLNGWILSVTEARQCALFSLVQA